MEQVVLFIFLKSGKLLIEKRFIEMYGDNQYLIPGGTVKQESIEEALLRETSEELGIKIKKFTPLPTEPKIKGLYNQQLYPFIIEEWEGLLPEMILDTKNPLVWLEFNEVLKTPIRPTNEVTQALVKYLKN